MKKLLIKLEDDSKMEVDLIRYFRFKNDCFLIYTLNELDDKGYRKLYLVKIMQELGEPVSQDIRNESEWKSMQSVVKKVIKEIKSGRRKLSTDLNPDEIEGIRINNPKFFKLDDKLLKILSSNYLNDEIINASEPDNISLDYKNIINNNVDSVDNSLQENDVNDKRNAEELVPGNISKDGEEPNNINMIENDKLNSAELPIENDTSPLVINPLPSETVVNEQSTEEVNKLDGSNNNIVDKNVSEHDIKEEVLTESIDIPQGLDVVEEDKHENNFYDNTGIIDINPLIKSDDIVPENHVSFEEEKDLQGTSSMDIFNNVSIPIIKNDKDDSIKNNLQSGDEVDYRNLYEITLKGKNALEKLLLKTTDELSKYKEKYGELND